MRGYKIRKKDDKWIFEFYPGKSDYEKPKGKSAEYATRNACIEAMFDFERFIQKNEIIDEKSDFVTIVVGKGIYGVEYSFEYHNESGKLLFYRDPPYRNNRANCQNAVKEIYRDIHEYVSHEIEDI